MVNLGKINLVNMLERSNNFDELMKTLNYDINNFIMILLLTSSSSFDINNYLNM